MFDPIDIVMLFGAVALAFKGISDYSNKKDKLKKHKEQLKKLEDKLAKKVNNESASC